MNAPRGAEADLTSAPIPVYNKKRKNPMCYLQRSGANSRHATGSFIKRRLGEHGRLRGEERKRSTGPDSPGLGQQDGVLVRGRGFRKVAEDGEPVLEELFSVVREQNVQRLHVTVLERGRTDQNPDPATSTGDESRSPSIAKMAVPWSSWWPTR